MELGIVLPTYSNFLSGTSKLAREKISKSKNDQAQELLKPKDKNTSIENQGKERIVDVSV